MQFSNGDKCWNGPDRSLKARLRCGLKNELADVDEPKIHAVNMKWARTDSGFLFTKGEDRSGIMPSGGEDLFIILSSLVLHTNNGLVRCFVVDSRCLPRRKAKEHQWQMKQELEDKLNLANMNQPQHRDEL
ncbi:hypothetical protein ACLOJK_000058 [Asimina triloba]